MFACIALANVSYVAAIDDIKTKAISVAATIPAGIPEMDNLRIIKVVGAVPINQTIFDVGTDVTADPTPFQFGTLDAGNNVWYSKTWFTVAFIANGYGKKYEVRSTCSGIGTISNTNSYFVLTPVYSEQDQWEVTPGVFVDQGAQPIGSVLGSVTNAVSTNKVIYASETAPSKSVMLQAIYAIPDKGVSTITYPTGWTGLPLSQAGGTYNGTVTISIVPV